MENLEFSDISLILEEITRNIKKIFSLLIFLYCKQDPKKSNIYNYFLLNRLVAFHVIKSHEHALRWKPKYHYSFSGA